MAWHGVARVVNWSERDVDITDHGKRGELSKAKTEENELVADVGCVSVKLTSVLARCGSPSQLQPSCRTEEPRNTEKK